jgi:hypothetical protein
MQTKIAYNPHCVVLYGKDFGKLVPWEQAAAHTWEIVGYPLARHILKAQHKLSIFLRKMVSTILKGNLDSVPCGNGDWSILVQSGFKRNHEESGIACSLGYEFSPPPTLDAQQIVKNIRCRAEAALDEAFMVQTDPIFARHVMKVGLEAPVYKQVDPEYRNNAAKIAVLGSVFRASLWQWLYKAALMFAAAQSSLIPDMTSGERLPGDYVTAVSHFEEQLMEVREFQTGYLGHLALQFPTSTTRSTALPGAQFHVYLDDVTSFRTDPLFWGISQLQDCDRVRMGRPIPYLVGFIDDALRNATNTSRSRLDTALYDFITDMGAVGDVLTSLKCLQSFESRQHAPPKRQSGGGLRKNVGGVFNSLADAIISVGMLSQEKPPDALGRFLGLRIPETTDSNTFQITEALHDGSRQYWKCIHKELIRELDALGIRYSDFGPESAVMKLIEGWCSEKYDKMREHELNTLRANAKGKD